MRELTDTIAGYSQSSLKNHGDQKRCLRAGRKQVSLWSSKEAKRRIQGATGQSASPQSPKACLILGTISGHVKNKKVIRSSESGFTKKEVMLKN